MSNEEVGKIWFWGCNNCGCREEDCDCQIPDLIYVWQHKEERDNSNE